MKKFGIFAIIALLPMLAGCATKVVDSRYPQQKLYLPAAARGEVYIIESVDTHVAQTPTPGSTFTFTIDWAEGIFRVPLSLYRAGVDNSGSVSAHVVDAADKVTEYIGNGTLPADTRLLNGAFYTMPATVTVAGGSSSSIFNIDFDLDYLLMNAPKNKFAAGLCITSDDAEVNESLSTIVILINTKVFDDPNLLSE